jgi:hypothetical protein
MTNLNTLRKIGILHANKLNEDVDYIHIIDQLVDLLMKVVGGTKFETI